jgi:AICAR transformylase/IMP cyclohydrolase PurH
MSTKSDKVIAKLAITDKKSSEVILSHRILELEAENKKLQELVAEYELEEKQRAQVKTVEEIICIEEIEKIKQKQDSEEGLSLNDVKAFDIIVRNLYALRNQRLEVGGKKSKSVMEIEELLSIVESK